MFSYRATRRQDEIFLFIILLFMFPGTSKSQNTPRILELPKKYLSNITTNVAIDYTPTNDVMESVR